MKKVRKLIMRISVFFTGLLGCILFILMLMQLRANQEELSKVKSYNAGNISSTERENVLKTLRILQDGYTKRDVSAIDKCIENTFSSHDVLILGTNPAEILAGKEGAKGLLHGDWAYWGEVKFRLDGSHFDQYNNTVYMATSGEIKIDFWHLRFPLRITGVLVKENSKWLISKLQFQYDLNTNLIIFSLLTAIGFSISIIFTLALLLWTKVSRRSDRRVTSKY
jgi:hypothetical protein